MSRDFLFCSSFRSFVSSLSVSMTGVGRLVVAIGSVDAGARPPPSCPSLQFQMGGERCELGHISRRADGVKAESL
jgi:hypothetical protein